ncbi:MAG: rhodanese-like domain-containing protein [Anaerolineae bacterium]|nr:rhodanese-like domain-containing protein [Anaerolineae bacterium]
MTIRHKSQVRATDAAPSAEANAYFRRKLGCETDPSDVYHDMQHDLADFVVLDVRSPQDYARSHVPGAINLPHAQITAHRMQEYAPETLFIVYCWGPGCNGATKAAIKLSDLGYPVKEMIGGIEYWEVREGYPVEREAVIS